MVRASLQRQAAGSQEEEPCVHFPSYFTPHPWGLCLTAEGLRHSHQQSSFLSIRVPSERHVRSLGMGRGDGNVFWGDSNVVLFYFCLCWGFVVLGVKPRMSHMLGNPSTTGYIPSPMPSSFGKGHTSANIC